MQPPPTNIEAVVLLPPELKSKYNNAAPFTARLAKRNTPLSPAEPSCKIICGQPRALALLKISESGNSLDLVKFYKCDLAGTVTICVRRSSCYTDRILEILRCACYKNIVLVLECFRTSDALYTIGKHYPLTLDYLIACKAFPDQKQLATIISQNLQCMSLGCSSTLMNLDREVKIAYINCYSIRPLAKVQASNLAPVGRVIMELMQKYVKDNRAVGINNLDYWQTCSAVVEFLSVIISASLLEELKKVKIRWSTGDLISLIWFALVSARTFYSYTPPLDKDK
ncbi:hypothetical protein BJX70DRAFT_392129 [Aspergillus crustosus]